MPGLEVQTFDQRVFAALGITNRRGFNPTLLPQVVPVCVLPLSAEGLADEAFPTDASVQAGEAFHLGYIQAAVAGQFSHLQLLNPAGSGKVCYVDQVSFSPGANDTVELRYYDTVLTDVAAGLNKDATGSNAAAHLRRGTNAAVLGTRINGWLMLGSTSMVIDFAPAIRLAEGKGLTLNAGSVNVSLTANFNWREKVAV